MTGLPRFAVQGSEWVPVIWISIVHVSCGGFHKWGYPKWLVYRENPTKIDDLGVSLFQETPIYPPHMNKYQAAIEAWGAARFEASGHRKTSDITLLRLSVWPPKHSQLLSFCRTKQSWSHLDFDIRPTFGAKIGNYPLRSWFSSHENMVELS